MVMLAITPIKYREAKIGDHSQEGARGGRRLKITIRASPRDQVNRSNQVGKGSATLAGINITAANRTAPGR
jgi:hypothetical protein